MFSRSSAPQSHIANRSVLVESLEGRRLMSASSIGADVLDLDASGNAQDFVPMNFVTESTKLLKIEGTFVGHYISNNYPKNTLTFYITKCTHTGHFTGSVAIDSQIGTLMGSVSGKVLASKHVSISVSGKAINGTFTGTASHTGGSFYGSYSVSGKGFSDTGTYHVGKA